MNKEETEVYVYTLEELVRAMAREREEEARQTRPHTDEKTDVESG